MGGKKKIIKNLNEWFEKLINNLKINRKLGIKKEKQYIIRLLWYLAECQTCDW